MEKFNYSRNEIDERPWGKYEVLLDAWNVKVKRITVNLIVDYHINTMINEENNGL